MLVSAEAAARRAGSMYQPRGGFQGRAKVMGKKKNALFMGVRGKLITLGRTWC